MYFFHLEFVMSLTVSLVLNLGMQGLLMMYLKKNIEHLFDKCLRKNIPNLLFYNNENIICITKLDKLVNKTKKKLTAKCESLLSTLSYPHN